jgi:dipeptidyl-peptidase III
MKYIKLMLNIFLMSTILSCSTGQSNLNMNEFIYQTEQFADTRILRYQVPGFDELSLNQKRLIYYLHEAALAGRDIYWDQNYKHNLTIRKTIEQILEHYNGNRFTIEFQSFILYAKRVFVANGIHHHYSGKKILPDFTEDYLIELINNSPDGEFPVTGVEELNNLIKLLVTIMFDPEVDGIKVNQDPQADMALESAVNFYSGVTQEEVLTFYNNMIDTTNQQPISFGLNSQLTKIEGQLVERIWRSKGMYARSIEQIVSWLEKALAVAENESQRGIIQKLIEFYDTGDLKIFDEYSVLWVQDTLSKIDFTNGFIEVYQDPFGLKGSYQSMVSIADENSASRVKTISHNAQWFEDNLPIHPDFKKDTVTGISARAIHVVALAGDNSPMPPLGVNLPNSDWIRREYGSKSVTITNIAEAIHQANLQNGFISEFACSPEHETLAREHGFLASNLYVDLHEIIGHGSGKLRPGVADMSITLKNYASTIEEARADLAALYFMMDPKMVDFGLIPSIDAGKAMYNHYIMNGMMLQLQRLMPGENIQQTHMRNRQLIASRVMQMGAEQNIIERINNNGKTCFVINDHQKLRDLFGQLLAEVQRIKSEGDYDAARDLVENYGVVADQQLMMEVHQRYEKIGLAAFTAFINPLFIPVVSNDRIIDVTLEYPENFLEQMLYYGKRYSFLPPVN